MNDFKTMLYKLFKENKCKRIAKILALGNKTIVYLRWLLYKNGILPYHSIRHKVISVGNLTVGGTGKTVMVEYLANKLLTKYKNPAILTRGYGRIGRDTLIIPPLTNWHDKGDEPYMLAQNLETVPVVIDPNRIRGAFTLLNKSPGPYTFILDDGFQYLKLKKDLNIVLVNTNDSLIGNQFIPAGSLRDGLWRLKEADIFVITKAKTGKKYPELRKYLRANNPRAEIFYGEYRPVEFIRIDLAGRSSLEELKRVRFFAFAGIAEPSSFITTLKEYGINPAGVKFFMDHHRYTQEETHELENEAVKSSAEAMVTTQKDAVRLTGYQLTLPTYYLRIGMFIRDEDKFLNAIEDRL